MPFHDDADDEFGFVPPLPPDDRLWRHPSERPITRRIDTPAPRRQRRHRSRLVVAFGVVVVAIVGVSAMALMRHDARRFASIDDWFALDEVPTALLEQVDPSIVRVTVERPDATIVTTGVMLREDGHLVTAADPIAGASAITVRVADGSVYNATIVGVDHADDLAVLDIPSGRAVAIRSATMATSRQPQAGDRAYVVGRTTGDERAWVAATTIDGARERLVASDGSVHLDMLRATLPTSSDVVDSSSGVVCDGDGTILGLVTNRGRRPATSSTSTSALLTGRAIVYATPIAWIERVTSDIIDTGSFHRAWIGVVADDAASGALVRSVVDRGPADRAGITPGDVITSISGSTVESADRLASIVRSLRPGTRISVERIRSDSIARLDVVVSEQS